MSTTGFQTFIPEDATSAAVRPTRVDPAPAFYLVYDPQRWDVLGSAVRPVLMKLKYMPGVGGVDLSPARGGEKRKVMMSIAKADAAERGRKVIPWDAVPDKYADANGQKSYLRRPDGRPDVTISIWETTYPDSTIIDSDEKGYHEWLDWLVSEGHIPECPDYKLRDLLSRKEEAELRAADMAQKQHSAEPDYQRAKAATAVVRKALDSREVKGSGKPKRAAKASTFTPEDGE
jgi:hypothetical protein